SRMSQKLWVYGKNFRSFQYLHSAFGAICALLAVSNFGVSSAFFFWSALPVGVEQVYQELPGKIVGQVALFCLYWCEYSHIAVSFNRLVNIAFPLQARHFFSIRVTLILFSLILLCSILEIVPYFKPEECYFTYDFNSSLWNFADTNCGHFCAFYLDFLTGIIILGIIFTMDAIALILFRRHRMHHSSNSDRNRTIEKKLFFQSICQVIPLFCAILTYHLIGIRVTSEWGLFLSYTFSWGMLHAVDGIVLVAFHARVIEKITSRFKKVY
ncbi:hypothetical protein PMAYCL1PPCAC_08726, partial [Pristionchus mayeri]